MELNNEGPTPSTMLARQLRSFRNARKLTLRALSEELNFQYSYLGRVERREQQASEGLAMALDKFFGTKDLFYDLYLMAEDTSVPDYGETVGQNEAKAERIQVFTSSLIPGLLQTEEYARALFRESLPWETEEQISGRISDRMRRQRLLARREPPFFWAIMDEAALKRPIPGKEGMCRQLTRVVEVCEDPHITVQVLPFEQGVHPMLGGSLILLSLRSGTSLAYTEGFASGQSVDSPRKILELTQIFDVARSKALPESESLALVDTYLREYKNGLES